MYQYLSIPVSPAKFYGDYSHVSKMTNTISSYNSFKNGMLHRCNSLIQHFSLFKKIFLKLTPIVVNGC